MSQKIAIIDENDNIIGYEEKLIVHQKAILHRAFSLFILNDKQEMLLQRRAKQKYHSPCLWTNACCSHLPEGEIFENYIHKRLYKEMGFDCEVKYKYKFKYKTKFDNGLWENEYDHIYLGSWSGIPSPDSKEVMDYKWLYIKDTKKLVFENPEIFTYWFRIAFEKLSKEWSL
jgi:isopentenyl-diphosphate Delta-isomerase